MIQPNKAIVITRHQNLFDETKHRFISLSNIIALKQCHCVRLTNLTDNNYHRMIICDTTKNTVTNFFIVLQLAVVVT